MGRGEVCTSPLGPEIVSLISSSYKRIGGRGLNFTSFLCLARETGSVARIANHKSSQIKEGPPVQRRALLPFLLDAIKL